MGQAIARASRYSAARSDAVSYDPLHHFIGAGLWDSAPLEATLWNQADELVGGDKAWLIIDDTALPKKGKASVRDLAGAIKARCVMDGAAPARTYDNDGLRLPPVLKARSGGLGLA